MVNQVDGAVLCFRLRMIQNAEIASMIATTMAAMTLPAMTPAWVWRPPLTLCGDGSDMGNVDELPGNFDGCMLSVGELTCTAATVDAESIGVLLGAEAGIEYNTGDGLCVTVLGLPLVTCTTILLTHKTGCFMLH